MFTTSVQGVYRQYTNTGSQVYLPAGQASYHHANIVPPDCVTGYTKDVCPLKPTNGLFTQLKVKFSHNHVFDVVSGPINYIRIITLRGLALRVVNLFAGHYIPLR